MTTKTTTTTKNKQKSKTKKTKRLFDSLVKKALKKDGF